MPHDRSLRLHVETFVAQDTAHRVENRRLIVPHQNSGAFELIVPPSQLSPLVLWSQL